MTTQRARAESVRVCMLSFYFQPSYSGSAVQAHGLSRRLSGLGVTPTIVSANLTASPSHESIGGIPLHRLPLCRSPALRIPTFAASLAWFLWRNRSAIDIVHAHGTMPHFAAGPVSRLLGRKSVLKIAMARSDIAFARQGRLWGRVNRFCARRFDRYVATSAEARDECIAEGLEPGRVRLIPNGVDTDRYRPALSRTEKESLRAALGLPAGPIVCFVGILDQRKNLDAALRVWNRVRQQRAFGHLLLVGPDPVDAVGRPTAFATGLREYVARNGLADSVTFAGPRNDVAECLRSSDVFFFPSRKEGMPNVLLEAMATGLPCVASAIGGTVDLLEDGIGGEVFALDDEQGMAAAIAGLLADPERAARVGAAGRERMERRYSLDSTARQYADLYRELLSDV